MTAIYYVSSPFQLMSALGIAKSRNATEDNIFVVLQGSKKREKNNKHFEVLIEESSLYASLHVISFNNIIELEFKLIFMFFKIKFSFSEVNEILVGDFRDLYSQLLLRRIKSKKRVIMDDGAATINILSNYISKGITYPQVKGVYNGLRFGVYRLLGMRFDNDIELVTESIFNGEKIRKSNLESKIEDFYFIGSKYSEAGIIPLALEVSLITHISTLYEVDMKYIPHRDDNEVKLSMLKNAGINVYHLSTPVEHFMETVSNKQSIALGGFWTTALYSLGREFCFAKVTSYDICDFLKSESRRQDAGNVYSYFKDAGIFVVDLKAEI
ncbi:hypothetical protein [Rheinheimera sp.]|uniref:hypothetical protein n=1 Tax=Rheinheimera sp. TaxID=1869214 RepID=UPI002733B5A8|nr:hypothetical protein [Rheinheimera sp.]MDP2715678.1 hypothetical protein [Rheinheimera sp.]